SSRSGLPGVLDGFAAIPTALYLETSPALGPATVLIVASPLRWLPGNGSPDSLTSIHFSSPMNPGSGGTLPGSNPDPSRPNPSLGSNRRPRLTNQCVGCCLVNQILKSVSCQLGTQVALGSAQGSPVMVLCNEAST